MTKPGHFPSAFSPKQSYRGEKRSQAHALPNRTGKLH
jgi:hypothetical protein